MYFGTICPSDRYSNLAREITFQRPTANHLQMDTNGGIFGCHIEVQKGEDKKNTYKLEQYMYIQQKMNMYTFMYTIYVSRYV